MPQVLGLCGTQVVGPQLGACYGLLPTETLWWLIQLGGSGSSFSSRASQVFITKLVNLFSRLIFVAVILSLVSLVLITFLHLVLIIASMCCIPCITLSHLRTHIRCAASVIRIVANLPLPFFLGLFRPFSFWGLGPFLILFAKHPLPRMSPRLSLGHSRRSVGQACSVRVHIILTASSQHLRSMCSMFSVSPHVWQCS